MAAAFAFALQALLTSVLVTQAEAAAGPSGSPFVICLSSDSAAPADHGSDTAPVKHLSCVLCTLAHGANAILAAVGGTVALDFVRLAAVVAPISERISQYHSPTGHYQRGPPANAIG